MTSTPLVIHVPHASTVIPDECRPQFVLDDAQLAEELDRITDHATDTLFHAEPGLATTVAFPVSRLVVDPERFENDDQEPMARRGMGVVYTRTTQQTRLRRALTPREREELLDGYYRPHHRRLTEAVDRVLDDHGYCLLVDAHSFPAEPLPYELDPIADRPDFCIGTDPDHTPEEVAADATEAFVRTGYSVLRNRPFGGSLVPMKHYRRDERVESVMIEVNRALYLDPPETSTRSERFRETQQAVAGCLRRLTELALERSATARSGGSQR